MFDKLPVALGELTTHQLIKKLAADTIFKKKAECISKRICSFQSGRCSFFIQTRSVLQPEFILGKLMLGRLIKVPDQ